MPTLMNRRDWLRTGAIVTGGLPFLSSFGSFAAPVRTSNPNRQLSDAEFARLAPPELKARLFANENPFGPSEKARKAIIDHLSTSYQYAFMHFDTLVQKVLAHEGIQKDMLLFSSGSSPLLMAAAIAFCREGGNLVTGDPTYDDLPEQAERFGATCKKVPLTADYKLDLDAMEKAVDANTKLVYICNPNNPTATAVDIAKLQSFCERVSKKTMVMVDEAYIDYMPDPAAATMIAAVKKGQNIIVARTFSKLYGFAGLRVGYMIALPETVKKLEVLTPGMFSISGPAIHAATAAYQDKEFLSGALAKTNESKAFLYKTLTAEGYSYIPSVANFVMFPVKMDSERFVQEMMKRGVGVRPWKFGGKEWCRVSIGRMDEMEAFAAAFKEIS
ncbi:histidinol-phosphate aminotransferase family protein [Chitinophaga horti]|uniref:Histidinol-phosphate aminotransferase family protein n=1 Tax=Chitinophaga horti TaxID=2920382 RepID=A0ABY6IYC7_9BACT|nr:histidinol-phosphate transaminase [Chitinophaga horti]UYQ92403.1 histidinol-phosphate aminotransferase family protein [Chitinophaga horti]